MGRNRRETTVAVKVEDQDLKELVALLGQAYALLANMPGLGTGGTSPAFTGGPPNATAPPTPNYGASMTSSANVAPSTGGVNPTAVHGSSFGFGPVGNGSSLFGSPIGPSPFSGGPGASLTIMGAVTINVQTMTVTSGQVIINSGGGSGGSGGGQSWGWNTSGPGGPGSSQPTVMGGNPFNPPPNSGGGGGSAVAALLGGMRGLAGGVIAHAAISALGTMEESAISGEMTSYQQAAAYANIATLGLGAQLIDPIVRRQNALTLLRGRRRLAGMPNQGEEFDPSTWQPDWTGMNPSGWTDIYNVSALEMESTLFAHGIAPNRKASDFLSRMAKSGDEGKMLAKDSAQAMLRANLQAGRYGSLQRGSDGSLWQTDDVGAMDPDAAASYLSVTGDVEGAIAVGALNPGQIHNMLDRARRGVTMGRSIATEIARIGSLGSAGSISSTRGNYTAAGLAEAERSSGLRSLARGEYSDAVKIARQARQQAIGEDAIAEADKRLAQAEEQRDAALAQAEESRLQSTRLIFEAPNRSISSRLDVTRSGLRTLSGTGAIYGSEMENLFTRERSGLSKRATVAQLEADYYRRTYGPDSQLTLDAESRLATAQSESATAPFSQIETKYAGLSSVASATSGTSRGAAQIIVVQGGGSNAALGNLLGSVLAAQVQAALSSSRLAEDQAAGAGPAILARDRLGIVQSGVDLAQQQAGLATYEPPAPFNTAMRTASNKLRRMQMSFLEPGNMLDEYNTLRRGAQGKVRAIDAYEKRLQQAGVEITPAMKDRLDAQRQEAQMEEFGYRVAQEDGWINRLVSWSSGAPSFSARIRPTMGEAAHQLEDHQLIEGYRQARQFGFVSSRGYRYERDRGNMTDGVGPLQMFPGDLGVQGAAGRRLPKSIGGASDADIDRLLGIGGAGSTADGSASESTAQAQLQALLQIAASLSAILAGTSKGQHMPGPSSYGGLGLGAHTENSGLGPKPGDTNLPR